MKARKKVCARKRSTARYVHGIGFIMHFALRRGRMILHTEGMRRFIFLLLGLSAAFAATLTTFAQAPTSTASPTPVPSGRAEWRFSAPGGNFVVPLTAIVSVSMHEYIVDLAARVTEVNVDTTGNALVRFYFIEPVTPQTPLGIGQSTLNKLHDLASEATSRTGQEEAWMKVSKTYPGSTHAHTIEFRVASKDDAQKIFHSADTALRTGQDTQVTLSE